MTARRGRKNPALLMPAKQVEQEGTVLVSGRPLRVGAYSVPAGVEVPGAASWPRLDAWISARHIKRVPADSEYVTWESFQAEVDALLKAEAEAAGEIVELEQDPKTQE